MGRGVRAHGADRSVGHTGAAVRPGGRNQIRKEAAFSAEHVSMSEPKELTDATALALGLRQGV